MSKKTFFWEFSILIIIVGVLNQIAITFHLYWFIYEFDSLVHFLAGMATSFFFLWLYFFSGLFNPGNRNLGRFLLISILGSIFIAVLWEIYELILGEAMIQKAEYAYDTSLDFIMDILGAITACFYGYLKESENKKVNE